MYIMAASICDTVLGYGFWAIIAHTMTADVASDSSLVISVMSATAHLTTAGIGLALASIRHDLDRALRMICGNA